VGQTGAELTVGLAIVAAQFDFGARATPLTWGADAAATIHTAGFTGIALVAKAGAII